MLKLAHVVNPLVVGNPASDLYFAQPVTVRSMALARAAAAARGIVVDQYAAFYEQDRPAVPSTFIPLPPLHTSILDIVAAPEDGRRLPLLSDILDRAFEAAIDADYLIYSNIDIGLWPDFYVDVASLIDAGADAFLVGRRTLSTEFKSVEHMERIFAQEGTPHLGFSCFVFPRNHYPRYDLDTTCIGLQPVGVTLAINMIQYARQFQNFDRVRMTFHLGDERIWEATLLDDCHRHNERALDRVFERMKAAGVLPRAAQIYRNYQSWRCNYVIGRCSRRVERDIYRAFRKAGFSGWVARRYNRVR